MLSRLLSWPRWSGLRWLKSRPKNGLLSSVLWNNAAVINHTTDSVLSWALAYVPNARVTALVAADLIDQVGESHAHGVRTSLGTWGIDRLAELAGDKGVPEALRASLAIIITDARGVDPSHLWRWIIEVAKSEDQG